MPSPRDQQTAAPISSTSSRPLCQFAAQLPEHTRRTGAFSREALGVRETLLSAREPATMLFRDLPEACGAGVSRLTKSAGRNVSSSSLQTLHNVVGELRAAYPELLNRIIERVAEALGEKRENFDRGRLATRAARVSLRRGSHD